MKKYILASTATLALSLSACGPAPGGYYDANGNWHADNQYNGHNAREKSPLPGGTDAAYDHAHPSRDYVAAPAYDTEPAYVERTDRSYTDTTNGPATTTTVTTYRFDRRGYYDPNGYYIAEDGGPRVASRYFPRPGLCRVWFPDRTAEYQPPVESCRGIEGRVPRNAYIIYGG